VLVSLIYINTFQRGYDLITGHQKEPVMWWSDYWRMSWMFFGPLMMLIFFFICLAVLGIVRGNQGGHALDILKERYARGEIDRAEFEERRHLLEA
jgi:putative membrane protein